MKKQKDSNQINSIDFSNPDLYQSWIKEITTPLNDPNIRFIFFIGGAGCGKSYTFTQLSIQEALAGKNWYWFKKVGATLRNSCFKAHKDIIDDYNLSDVFEVQESMRIKNTINKAEIFFTGLDDSEKIKSVVSPDVIVMEEGSDFDFNDFVQLNIRLRGKHNQKLIVLSNKVSHESWIKTKILDNPAFDNGGRSTKWIEKTVIDNRFADPVYIEALRSLKDIDPLQYKIYFENDWGSNSEGLVYDSFIVF
ncbi:MAG: PBSX family phage terminase large subunit [Patescibacteria group bacterium]